MATFAGQSLMRAIQDIVGLLVVVEYPQWPAVRVMAAIAEWAEALMVRVITPVTVDAGAGSILVSGRQMTFFTGHDCMQADERELSQVMIEKYFPAPCLLVVTVVASFPLLAVVNIVA